ncbi:MAG: alpha/beta hydrolase [Pseudomonadota bacterium]
MQMTKGKLRRATVTATFSVIAVLLLVGATVVAHAQPISAHKDRLFAYPKVLDVRDNGAYRILDYRESRDIDRRDEIPERRVKRAYIDFAARRATKKEGLDTPVGRLTYRYAGQLTGSRFFTIYIHGSGGDSRQGVDDFTFGGNFNRIKALMIKSGGAYIAPDAGNFAGNDLERIKYLLIALGEASPSARIVIACGSAGAAVCYQVAQNQSLLPRLAGFVFLGAYGDTSFVNSAAGRARIPVMIAHGGSDRVYPVSQLDEFYSALRNAGLPVRMVNFSSGTHGTPIRMIDWRETLNWLLTY